MSEKTRSIIIKVVIGYLILCAITGIVSAIALDVGTKRSWEQDSRSYFSENAELRDEIGEIFDYKCLGRKSKGEPDGLPVCFEVKAEKGEYYVLLWFDRFYPEDEYQIVKHRVTTTIPEDFF